MRHEPAPPGDRPVQPGNNPPGRPEQRRYPATSPSRPAPGGCTRAFHTSGVFSKASAIALARAGKGNKLGDAGGQQGSMLLAMSRRAGPLPLGLPRPKPNRSGGRPESSAAGITAAAVWLCPPEASCITGSVLVADDGWLAG